MDKGPNQESGLQRGIVVPEKHFLRVMQEQSQITRLRIWTDFGKELAPYVTALLMLVFVGLVCPQALILAAPALSVWVFRNLKDRAGKRDRDDNH